MRPESWIVWRFIVRYIDAYGLPPTQMEIGRACGIKHGQARLHLHELADCGCIRFIPRRIRGYELLMRPEEIPGHVPG